jgi:hypothetical protein
MPSKSVQQQKFFGMVRRCQKTGICPSDRIEKAAQTISHKAVHDFAATPHKNLPKKIHKKKKKKKLKEGFITFNQFLILKESTNCTCSCVGCLKGDCSECSCAECKCPGCNCGHK